MFPKRATACLLMLCLTLGTFSLGEAADENAPVVVGASTMPGGSMGLGLWSDNTTDIDIRQLLHGYETVSLGRSQGITLNGTVLRNVREEVQPDGDDVVIFELAPGLTYNTGEEITARDYVFTLLLLASPELAALDAKPGRLEYLRGYEDYHAGITKALSGVRLLSDTSFSLRVKAESLPYFYGIGRLEVRPYPIWVIAPGCAVADDGQGAYLTGGFSTEMLAETLLDPVNGYEVNPRITCGPYQLYAYDAGARMVRLRINPRFIGNYAGEKPTVERLEIRYAPSWEVLQKLQSGELDIAIRVADKEALRQGRELVDQGIGLRAVSYPRTGLTVLAFACERGPQASAAVRKAVALSLDKDAITREIGGEYAQRVYGYYGKDQWLAERMEQELAQLNISHDPAAAKALLEGEGWTLNGEGNPFRDGVDPIRYRAKDGRLVPLLLWIALPEESPAAWQISDILTGSLGGVGIGAHTVHIPFNDLLVQYYRQQERLFDLFYLSSNFTFLFDPFYKLNPNEAFLGIANKTGIQDAELDALAQDLRATPLLNRDLFAQKWLAFQRGFVRALPMLPLYSNTYFDFYTERVVNYEADAYASWALSVPALRVQ